MKKIINNLMYVAIMVTTSFAFGACSSDSNDEPGSSGPTIIAEGQLVDLGLSVDWAGWNIGASSPEEFGGYYAWGETHQKDNYSFDSYCLLEKDKYGKWPKNIGTQISGTKYDVARQAWGGEWRMPTREEFEELKYKCDWKWTQLNGVYGYEVTGPNGNSIFLPAAGYYDGTILKKKDTGGCYWSGTIGGGYDSFGKYDENKLDGDYTLASYLSFTKVYSETGSMKFLQEEYKYMGLSVRPVMPKSATGDTEGGNIEDGEEDVDGDTEEDKQIPRGTDLGLPSGRTWADWNIGALSPEEFGGYYAWGEIKEKEDYSLNTYVYYDVEMREYVNDNIKDVASALWGNGWRIPTKEEFEELITECEWEWTQYNGVNGYEVIGPNGNSIFLPAAGYRGGTYSYDNEVGGNYWTSTYNLGDVAYGFGFSRNYYGVSNACCRIYGHTIRPVK